MADRPLLVGLVALAAALGALAPVAASIDATPVAGPGSNDGADATVTTGSTLLTWQGKHFEAGAVPRPEACTDVTCDTYRFAVDLPPGYWETRDGGVEVAIRWPSEQDDFELYVYDASGAPVNAPATEVANSTGSYSMADGALIREPTNGPYRVVVVPLTVDNSSYEGLVQLEPRPEPHGEPRAKVPNLVARPPTDLKLVAPVGYGTGTELSAAGRSPASCGPDETVEDGARQCLRFSQAALNDGDGDLELRYYVEGGATGAVNESDQRLVQRIYYTDGSYRDRRAGTYRFHKIHGHYHYEGFAGYQLYRVHENGTRTHVRDGGKKGFCLEDVALHAWAERGNGPRGYSFPECNVPSDRTESGTWMVQGISKGWTDVYTWDLPDQYVDVTGLPDGVYRLEVTIDPNHTLRETTRTDNDAWVRFRLHDGQVTVLETSESRPRS